MTASVQYWKRFLSLKITELNTQKYSRRRKVGKERETRARRPRQGTWVSHVSDSLLVSRVKETISTGANWKIYQPWRCHSLRSLSSRLVSRSNKPVIRRLHDETRIRVAISNQGLVRTPCPQCHGAASSTARNSELANPLPCKIYRSSGWSLSWSQLSVRSFETPSLSSIEYFSQLKPF